MLWNYAGKRRHSCWKTSADNCAMLRRIVGKELNIQTVVYESGATSFSLARTSAREGITAVVAAPAKLSDP